MWAKAIVASSIIWVIHATYAFAVEPQFIDPDTTQFKFASEEKGSNKFCNLIVSAVKMPSVVVLNAVAWRRGSGDSSMIFGYEVNVFETTIENGIPSVPKRLKIRDANISSNIFSSQETVERVGTEGALYTVKNAGLGGFTATMIRGSYFININLLDGRSLAYVIRGDKTLLDAATNWTKCSIQIAK